MTKSKVCFKALQLGGWARGGFGRSLFLLLLGTIFVGPWGESGSGSASRSSDDLLRSFTTVLALPQTPYDTNVTENNFRRKKRSSASADSEDSALPQQILTASHLSSLRDLISDKKITVRLRLHVSLTGPSELLDPQLLILLNKESGIYNTGRKSGLFTMQIVGTRKVTSKP